MFCLMFQAKQILHSTLFYGAMIKLKQNPMKGSQNLGVDLDIQLNPGTFTQEEIQYSIQDYMVSIVALIIYLFQAVVVD